MKTMNALPLLQNLHSVDARAFRWCNTRKRRDQLAAIALWVSRTGDGPLYAIIGLSLALLGGEIGRLFFACGVLAYAFDVPLYLWMKNKIKRERPFKKLATHHYIVPSDEFSFPSGHTAAACVWAVLVTTFYPPLAPLMWAWAVAVGSSRVFLGVHYPGDIVAGAVLGSGCALLALSILM